ncbi:glycosyltransferase [Clostridium botulinum C str. Eklund]|nr:glycosyltransferase [Clostridium botulinum C str. Eklund]NEZ48440.1 UDP-2,4-diacetamido-2,4,6-trideoxy-beta-L-altropyranose hydrolase [Clostridium botulinum]
MNICIRADGGSEIGMGHVMRTLVLAKELRKAHKVFYTCRVDEPLTDKYKSGIDFIKRNGFNIVCLNENRLKQDIKEVKADCIITDSYDVDEEYFNICKEHFKVSGCLDDEKICDYFNVDFLINQNPYALELNYKVNQSTKLMLGMDFVILRDEFRENNLKEIKKNMKDIMITVGGSDNNNVTERIIAQMYKSNYKLHVVVGPSFKYVHKLKKYENDNVKLYFNTDMKKLMNKCDICISSCGTTIYELAACGVPTIGIVVVENQEMAADKMNNIGAIRFSEINELNDIICRMEYYHVRKSLRDKCMNLVDGRGINRIVKKIEECF